jgi:dipeptidyl aminopeptidase/acylaminoacyl peptidase
LFLTRFHDSRGGDVRLVRLDGSGSRVLCEEGGYDYQVAAAAWTPDGSSIVLRSNRTGWSKLWLMSPADGSARPLTEGEWDERDFCLAAGGAEVACASRRDQEGAGDDLWALSLAGGRPRRLTRHPGINLPLAWAADGRVFYWHTSPTEPGDLWAVPESGGPPRRLTYSAPLELERKLAAPEEVVVPGEAGGIPTLIYRPVDYQPGQKYPALLWMHGGPSRSSRFEFSPFHNWLANLGFIVLSPNFRGSTGYGLDYAARVSGEGVGKADLADVLATARFARALPEADLGRGLGIGGHSWGGYLTLLAIAHAPHEFACAYASRPITDWRIQQPETEVRYYDHWLLGGWVYEHPERAVERSPVSYVDRIRVPLAMDTGDLDDDVPFRQCIEFAEKARAAGVAIDFKVYRGESHYLHGPEAQADWLGRVRDFYRRHLHPWDYTDNPPAMQVQRPVT